MRLRTLGVWIALVLVAGACGEGTATRPEGDAGASPEGGELIVSAASYDVAAGDETRLIVGLQTPDRQFVSYGEVPMELFYLGTEEGEGTAEEGPVVTGRFLLIDGGGSGETPDVPTKGTASDGRGVYAAEVTFDKAGFWAVQVATEVDGEKVAGQSVFEVLEDHQVPAVGDRAPRTENLLPGAADAPPAAVDSRARSGEPLPDPELHEITVADALAAGEPFVLVISTPVYCVSQFCGPVTDVIAGLARDYGDRARFIHIEVWRNFQGRAINKAAADWIYKGGDLQEPWVFLVDDTGRIAARWDNVATRAEIEPLLKKLPKL